MTNEEALKGFKNLYESIDKENHLFVGTINPEFIMTAIKALEQLQDVHDTCKKCIEFSEFKQHPSGDYVSRESIVNKINNLQDELTSNDDSKWSRNKLAFKYMAYVNGIILNEPSVYPERPKGKWMVYAKVEFGDFKDTEKYKCSECGHEVGVFLSRYCPNCGSYNGGEEE